MVNVGNLVLSINLRGLDISSQHGPLIFCSKRNNSKLDLLVPNTWLKVSPYKSFGRAGNSHWNYNNIHKAWLYLSLYAWNCQWSNLIANLESAIRTTTLVIDRILQFTLDDTGMWLSAAAPIIKNIPDKVLGSILRYKDKKLINNIILTKYVGSGRTLHRNLQNYVKIYQNKIQRC